MCVGGGGEGPHIYLTRNALDSRTICCSAESATPKRLGSFMIRSIV